MRLKYCSITGADDQVAIRDLVSITKEYPFVEWAILLLPGKEGTPRFPKIEWIKKFSKDHKWSHTAMHLCGQALLDFIARKKETLDLMQGFKRIQLNLKFGDVEGKYDPKELAARVKESHPWQFILQYAADKKNILPLFEGVPNHAVLFDASAGRGMSPARWDPPLKGHFCGYAGGINPDNVVQNLEMIARAAHDYETWIDMESGVRTSDQFDLAKVRAVLDASAVYTA